MGSNVVFGDAGRDRGRGALMRGTGSHLRGWQAFFRSFSILII
jgi:hypothetical protein